MELAPKTFLIAKGDGEKTGKRKPHRHREMFDQTMFCFFLRLTKHSNNATCQLMQRMIRPIVLIRLTY